MELQSVLEGRYSCRKFNPEPLTHEQIVAVLEAGRLAPTARNLQPQRMYVVTKPQDLEKVDDCSPCRYNAPAVIILGYDKDVAGLHRQSPEPWNYGNVDSTSALVHMLLKAHDMGLGTLWVGMYDDAKVIEAFNLPANFELRALIMLGKPADDCTPSEMHTTRKPLEETVTWL